MEWRYFKGEQITESERTIIYILIYIVRNGALPRLCTVVDKITAHEINCATHFYDILS